MHEADDLAFDTIEPWIAYVSPESPFSSRTPAIDGLDRICMSTSQHISELTNALRTLLLNVRTLEWDPILLRFFGLRESVLARLASTSEVYGNATYDPLECAACWSRWQPGPGQMNIWDRRILAPFCMGTVIVYSNHRLLSMVRDCGSGSVGVDTARQVAYQVRSKENSVYALEGASESTTFSLLLCIGAHSPHSCCHMECYQMATGLYEDD